MTERRDPDVILAAWLDEGPHVLPESTRRAINVTTRTTNQARRLSWLPWRATNMNGTTRLALAAAAVVAIAVGGLYVLRPAADGPGGAGSPVPSAAASPAASIPEMTAAFTSDIYGYALRYPADWRASAGAVGTNEPADLVEPASGGGGFRGYSAVAPDLASIDDWISQNLTQSDIPDCAPPRNTLEQIVIDGHPGRLRGFCGNPTATEIEATVVVDRRVYVFTLFRGPRVSSEADERALFDAFMATISLKPQDAQTQPSIIPGPS